MNLNKVTKDLVNKTQDFEKNNVPFLSTIDLTHANINLQQNIAIKSDSNSYILNSASKINNNINLGYLNNINFVKDISISKINHTTMNDIYIQNNELSTPIHQLSKSSHFTVKWLLENYEEVEGISILRNTLYCYYLHHCTSHKLDPINAASFGKLIRSVFSNIKTRRLGTRGNSKYHYYGLRIQPQSPLNNLNDEYLINIQNILGSKYNDIIITSDRDATPSNTDDAVILRPIHRPKDLKPRPEPAVGKNGFELESNDRRNHNIRDIIGMEPGVPDHIPKPLKMVKPTLPSSTGKKIAPDPLDLSHITASHYQQFLGNVGPLTLPNFDPSFLRSSSAGISGGEVDALVPQLSLDSLSKFLKLYKLHVEVIIESVVNLNFSLVKEIWDDFWSSPQHKHRLRPFPSLYNLFDKCEIDRIASFPPLLKYVLSVDTSLYEYLIDVLISDVLEPVPSQLTQAIRSFAKKMGPWIKDSLVELPKDMVHTKVVAVEAFSQTLRRLTSLNHLAQAARNVLQNQAQVSQMLIDLDRMDVASLQQQVFWMTGLKSEMVYHVIGLFRKNLENRLSLEEWATWSEDIIMTVLDFSDTDDDTAITKKAKTYLLHWSFYSSLLIKDMTLRSAASFGSYHILRLLFEEYVNYIVEKKMAGYIGQTPLKMLVQNISEYMLPPSQSVQAMVLKGAGHDILGTTGERLAVVDGCETGDDLLRETYHSKPSKTTLLVQGMEHNLKLVGGGPRDNHPHLNHIPSVSPSEMIVKNHSLTKGIGGDSKGHQDPTLTKRSPIKLYYDSIVLNQFPDTAIGVVGMKGGTAPSQSKRRKYGDVRDDRSFKDDALKLDCYSDHVVDMCLFDDGHGETVINMSGCDAEDGKDDGCSSSKNALDPLKVWPFDRFDTDKLFNDTAFEYIDLITSYNLNMPHKSNKNLDYGHFNDDSQINYDSLIFDR